MTTQNISAAALDKEKSSFATKLNNFENTLKYVFYERYNINEFSKERGLPALVLRDIMADCPLSVAIPKEHGGRGANVRECLAMLSAASYESLSLSLIFGINIALFLEPTAKYANPSIKQGIFDRFLQQKNMGGLMITEPDFGSDALNMQTYNRKLEDSYHISGTKHWQGLTGMADYWLIASRGKRDDGRLNRDIDFFICDVTQPDQQIVVEEYYNNSGLYAIPYGRNKLDVKIPDAYKLESKSNGIKTLLDILHRSRLQFPGMALGFVKRMLDEGIKHCNERYVGGNPLMALDQIKYQLARVQSAFTVVSAMCHRSSHISGIDNDLASEGIEANTMKAFATDLMQDSAQAMTQLLGSKGYMMESIVGRGIMDSRAFQIFEGSNEMLYTQITEYIAKLMKKKKEFNFYDFLKGFSLTDLSVEYFKKELNFDFSTDLCQRKMVDLGRVLSRVISFNYVLDMQDKGFRSDLVDNCLETLKLDVAHFMGIFNANNSVVPVEAYHDKSNWQQFF
ncbi:MULTISPECIES: acyl-CoA dehydrogenase family protein [Flavobacteriaceae]|uniref:acyl-CoA dehydrogenase family protein n=1 Tax=Flavobacteriaceae TaxID=49546 RepID=UPI001490A92E|nr:MULTISPECIES: acyl-CoA dehydrogenase family protein [Allomuricauda]MDC6364707.1 acyl-CoA/acyl-ACP dehydrogenase [Muricauda sp. AC10]